MRRLFVVALLLGLAVGSANALVSFGDPFEGNSWSQGFVADTGYYDFFRVDWISGGYFEGTPVVTGISKPGWTAGWSSMTSGSASGPLVTSKDLTFVLTWFGTPATPLSFYFHAYDTANNIVDSAKATWNGGWGFTACGWHPGEPREDPNPIPEPASLLLCVAALGVVGVAMRRRVKP